MGELTSEYLAELLRLADGVETRPPWETRCEGHGEPTWVCHDSEAVYYLGFDTIAEFSTGDGEFIAALNPAVAKALVAEIVSLRAQRDGEGDVASGTLWRAERDLAITRNEHAAQKALHRDAASAAEDAVRRIDAALALHAPVDALHYGPKNTHKVQVCTGCGQDDGNWNQWPCATVRALTAPAIPGEGEPR